MSEIRMERKDPEQKIHAAGNIREEHKEIKTENLQEVIGYKFKNIKLLYNAMSHSSYANEHRFQNWRDNERIEFLGDAVLELSSSTFLYKMHPEMPEGDLTKLHASRRWLCVPVRSAFRTIFFLAAERSRRAEETGIRLCRMHWNP